MSHLLVKAIRVRVLNSPKVSLYRTRIIFLCNSNPKFLPVMPALEWRCI